MWGPNENRGAVDLRMAGTPPMAALAGESGYHVVNRCHRPDGAHVSYEFRDRHFEWTREKVETAVVSSHLDMAVSRVGVVTGAGLTGAVDERGEPPAGVARGLRQAE